MEKGFCFIALGGYAGSGKSTIAKYLEEKYEFKIVPIAFTVKKIAKELFPELPFQKPYTEHERYILQALGSGIRDYIDKDYYINITVDNIAKLKENGVRRIVVDDLRFKNEEEKLRKLGFKIVKVVANDQVRLKRLGDPKVDPKLQEKEVELLSYDFVVHNENFDDLTSNVDKIFAFCNKDAK